MRVVTLQHVHAATLCIIATVPHSCRMQYVHRRGRMCLFAAVPHLSLARCRFGLYHVTE